MSLDNVHEFYIDYSKPLTYRVFVNALQVTSHPPQQNFARLQIIEAYSVIPGAPDFYVRQGSSLRLECRLLSATEPPVYVFWYRQGRMINYDSEPGVKVEFNESGSILIVNNTKLNHGGNYTCAPSNAKPTFIVVHVIEGKNISMTKLSRSYSAIV